MQFIVTPCPSPSSYLTKRGENLLPHTSLKGCNYASFLSNIKETQTKLYNGFIICANFESCVFLLYAPQYLNKDSGSNRVFAEVLDKHDHLHKQASQSFALISSLSVARTDAHNNDYPWRSQTSLITCEIQQVGSLSPILNPR